MSQCRKAVTSLFVNTFKMFDLLNVCKRYRLCNNVNNVEIKFDISCLELFYSAIVHCNGGTKVSDQLDTEETQE